MAEFQLGSISTGTLRTEDLLPAFTYTMGELTHNPISNTSKYPNEAMAKLWDEAIHLIGTNQWWTIDPEDSGVDGLLDDLTDALNELCPPFVYFGTLEGDGADFGFWVDHANVLELMLNAEENEEGDAFITDDGLLAHDGHDITYMDMERNVIWSTV